MIRFRMSMLTLIHVTHIMNFYIMAQSSYRNLIYQLSYIVYRIGWCYNPLAWPDRTSHECNQMTNLFYHWMVTSNTYEMIRLCKYYYMDDLLIGQNEIYVVILQWNTFLCIVHKIEVISFILRTVWLVSTSYGLFILFCCFYIWQYTINF